MRTVAITLALLAGAAFVPAALAAPPSGQDTLVGLTSSIGPAISKPGGPSRSMGLTVGTTFRSPAPNQVFRPQTLTKAEILFSNGAIVNSKLFPGCNVSKLIRARGNRKVCPKGSHIGSGKAIGKAGDTDNPLVQPLTVDVYVGKPGKNLIFYLRSSRPISINQAIVAPLVPVKSHFYAWKLTLKVPQTLQLPLPGVPASVTDFNVTVKGTVKRHGRKRGFVETSLCPPGAQVPINGRFTFADGAVQTLNSGIVCGGKLP
ncbi:MAG TPA: hypothetical protein VGF25_07740 [Thermoleophilaceae bacterium]|jgi:hypothetical protein